MSSVFKEKIQTVSGLVAASGIGHIQCHEHIYLRKGPSYQINQALCMDDFGKSLQELKDYKAAGGSAIVDAQPGGFGRDGEMLCRLAEESGVQIIAVTGFHKKVFIEPESPLNRMKEDQLTQYFISELEEGMFSVTGHRLAAKAGMLKVALEENGLSDEFYQPFFRAVGRAAKKTGAPIMVHTEKNVDVLELLAFFKAYEIDEKQILICHLDRTRRDVQYHLKVLKAGCYLCYDSVNRLKYVSHEQELELIRDICSAGYSSQVLLSLDTTNQRLRSYNAQDMGLDYILTTYKTMLEQYGIDQKQIEEMCHLNALKLFEK